MRNNPTEEGRPSVLEHESGREIRPLPAGPGRPPGRKRRFRPFYLFLAIAVVALVVIWKVNHVAPAFPRAPGRGGRRSAYAMNSTLPVVVQPAAKGDISIYLNGLGTVTPLATVTVQTQISGLLMEVAFKEGQLVKKGDLLAVVDPRPYQVALEQAQGNLMQAEAELTEARVDLARYQTLAKQDSIALQQVDTQRALAMQYQGLVKTDQAAIDSANLNLTYCHITAPVAGRVGLRQVDPGNYVTPTSLGNGLVVLTQLQPITVIFTLPEDNIPAVVARLRSGAALPVEAFDRSLTTKLASGTLSTIDNVVDTTTGTFRLRAVFPNTDDVLFPNQFVNIRMLLNLDRGAILIPTSGIERGQQGTYVYVVKPDSTVTARPVTLGPTEGEKAAVVSGLAVGEEIVVDGADKLKEGMKVTAQRPGPAGQPGPKPAGRGGAAGTRRQRGARGGGAGGTERPGAGQ